MAEALKKARTSRFPITLIPVALDISKLYDIDANQHMWMVDLLPTEGDALPLYLTDEDVRRGMKAVEMKDRAKEEMARLQQEHAIVCLWFDVQLSRLKCALDLCEGELVVILNICKS